MPQPPPADMHPFDALVQLMDTLRGPEGCPWDHEQTLQSLKKYALEETYEVLDAIDGGDPAVHRDELGDLLLQVVFQSCLRKEEGAFDVFDVCRAIVGKLVRRHPHVYGEAVASSGREALASWESIKAAERAAAGRKGGAGLLDGIPRALPALSRAQKLTGKAARVGFDWPSTEAVLPKVAEEAREVLDAPDPAAKAAEFGDLLFALVNLGRHLGIDCEEALHGANRRFTERFSRVEAYAAEDERSVSDCGADELDAFWERAKAELGS